MKRNAFSQGFSLIEILIVMSSIIVLSGIGFATLATTQRRQAVEQSQLDIKIAIERTKYNAVSRVKRPGCPTAPLTHMDINFCSIGGGCLDNTNDYEIFSICGSETNVFEEKKLRDNLNLAPAPSSTCRILRFSVGSSSLQNMSGSLPCNIILQKYGITRTLVVDSSGNVRLN